MMLPILFLSLSMSLDAFGIGLSYGMRGIAVPLPARAVISLQSVLITASALLCGRQLTVLFSPQLASNLGVGLLCFMGLFLIVQSIKESSDDRKTVAVDSAYDEGSSEKSRGKETHIDKNENRGRGKERRAEHIARHSQRTSSDAGPQLVARILRHPDACDLNHSQAIDPKEALYLGFALSADAFGAGLGSGAAGLCSVYLPLSVAAAQFLLLSLGRYTGAHLQQKLPLSQKRCGLFSGSLLIGVGLWRIL